MEPRTITLPVTFRVGSLRTLGLAGGPSRCGPPPTAAAAAMS
jgi:hypothetical protein